MLTGNLNATRFAQKPIPQPTYCFSHIPRPSRNLEGSVVQNVEDREDFQWCMAEMLLLCKEATRRSPEQKAVGGSKPLSLEYLADRLDIDDPCFGYLVRTDNNLNNDDNTWKKGMLQGFITVTTFTNWQKSFEWNSMNSAAYQCDSDEYSVASGVRKWDEDGSLSRELQSTVRCGDIWNEGIVWPRVAEISLLGALGCGRALVSLVIEDLEAKKASRKANYDYVALQATDNSIPFYESLGFVRVGTVMKEDIDRKVSASDNAMTEGTSPEIVSSEVISYKIQKAGESLNDIARKFKVDVWDIVFLNQHVDESLSPSTKLYKGTELFVPGKPGGDDEVSQPTATSLCSPNWHVAKENETPRTIAKKYGVNCIQIVEANKRRLPELISSSRLKDGTRIKVSHFDQVDDEYKPYSHWSFPDDEFEEGEPSYMMVRKLNRKKSKVVTQRPFRESLAAMFSPYEKSSLLAMPSFDDATPLVGVKPAIHKHPKNLEPTMSFSKATKPEVPAMPSSAYLLFLAEQRELAGQDLKDLSIGEISKTFGDLWRDMPETIKANYERLADEARKDYEKEKQQYETEYANYVHDIDTPSDVAAPESAEAFEEPPLSIVPGPRECSLFNSVVRLRPGSVAECSEYKYWYVLTFIPDLKWCHLAPMIQMGEFGPDKPSAHGRPKWKLVDESLGHEVDISSNFCIPVKSRSMKKTLDADKEEWNIIDDGVTQSNSRSLRRASSSALEDCDSESPSIVSGTSSNASCLIRGRKTQAIKPSVERKRKRHSCAEVPSFQALPADATKSVAVQLECHSMENGSVENEDRRKRSRAMKSATRSTPDRVCRNKTSIIARNSGDENTTCDRSQASQGYNSDEGSSYRATHTRTRFSAGDAMPRRASLRSRVSIQKSIQARPRRAAAPSDLAESSAEPDESSDETVETISTDTYTECRTLSEEERYTESGSLSDESEFLSTVGLRRSSRRVEMQSSHEPRPRRAVAPTFLHQSPVQDAIDKNSTPRRSNRRASSPSCHQSLANKSDRDNLNSPSQGTRARRKPAPSFLGEGLPRKPRMVNSVGSRRSVLQD